MRKHKWYLKKLTAENYVLLFSIIIFLIFLIQVLVQTGFSWRINFSMASDFGKAIGGILSFVSIVYLFLGMKSQLKSFSLNQFENRYYEQIKYHRANITALHYKSPRTKEYREPWMLYGNQVMVEIFNEVNLAIRVTREHLSNLTPNQIYKDPSHIKGISCVEERQLNITDIAIIDISYIVVVFGVSVRSKMSLRNYLCKHYKKDLVEDIILIFRRIPVEYSKFRIDYIKGREIKNNAKFVKYFGGHQHRIGHYFRHFYQSICYVNKNNEKLKLSFAEKYNYVKKYRAQLSTFEQALLFFNSVSSLGRSWELNLTNYNDHLITKYNLIKNIPQDYIEGFKIKDFYPDVKYEGEEDTDRKYELLSIYK